MLSIIILLKCKTAEDDQNVSMYSYTKQLFYL